VAKGLLVLLNQWRVIAEHGMVNNSNT
jgi:hypothetical protein